MATLIYEYYEDGQPIEGDKANFTYICKLCKAKGINKIIKSATTSNLITHLKTKDHLNEYLGFEKKQTELTPTRASKRLRYESPISSVFIQSPKYSFNSGKQRER